MRFNSNLSVILGVQCGFCTLILYVSIQDKCILPYRSTTSTLPILEQRTEKAENLNTFVISSNVKIVNLSAPIVAKFNCIKTKTLLNHFTTNICLHETKKDVRVSGSFHGTQSIWEEDFVTRILQLLIRHPHLDFIDIGANIGTYTMYVAAMGRFVLAIDCFEPNIDRLHRSIQLSNVANRVVLIRNALFTRSGETLRLSPDPINIGGQEIDVSTANKTNHMSSTLNDPYLVKTITFDDLLPILIARGIRGALIKMDIEGSESFVVESGNRIFDTLEIPFVQMEWLKIRHHADRVRVIFNFFLRRNYYPATTSCQLLNTTNHTFWPNEICWMKRNYTNLC